ncbi:alpha/beta hydrolase [Aureispira anguillae]|uniref:Alpha/beta hydrolase-fold protein n=1 Tax=Aureispira anguillae TaxID=2864201 RepID=A0A915YLS2_9BACT|nr:alpha/beta hydrolase-fold protein [Aureispira anguillae]BDS15271.1 alpha/beta hydrolase-fold protein [Aureispira anguillae]
MKHLIIMVMVLLSLPIFAQNKIKINKKAPLTIGDRVEIKSKILNEDRILNIYLPNGYSNDSTKTYPVIYLLDGSIDEDFIHIAGIVQFGSFPWINMIPETIVVGISNVDRKRDFTFPTQVKRDKKDFPTTGESENFITFIEKELQPFIKDNYKTNATQTIIGQSLGGLLATEILFTKPQLFDNYIIVSPSLWWNKESLLKETPIDYQSKKSIYIAVGKEGKVMERTAKELYDKLHLEKKKDTQLFFEFFEKQNHGDALHLAVYSAFEKLFQSNQ